MKKKRDRNDFIYKDLVGEELRREQGWLKGQGYKCNNLEDCKVEIWDRTGQVTIINCRNCNFILGPCSGSIFVRESKNCTFYSISNQLRISDSENITVYAYSQSRPALDHCNNIIFAPINIVYDGLKEQFESSEWDVNSNKWFDVHDFTLEKDQKVSPYYKLMDPNDYTQDIKVIDSSMEKSIFWVPKQYGGELEIELINSDLVDDNQDGVNDDGLIAFQIGSNPNPTDFLQNNNESNPNPIDFVQNNNESNPNTLNNSDTYDLLNNNESNQNTYDLLNNNESNQNTYNLLNNNGPSLNNQGNITKKIVN